VTVPHKRGKEEEQQEHEDVRSAYMTE